MDSDALEAGDTVLIDFEYAGDRLQGEATIISRERGGLGHASRIEVEVGSERRTLNHRQFTVAVARARRARGERRRR
ncbi:MAG: hypothetical protein ACTHQQ_10565 [Solirubrobacteraceae bacterium]